MKTRADRDPIATRLATQCRPSGRVLRRVLWVGVGGGGLLAGLVSVPAAPAKVVFEATSAYHHIRVVDDDWVRTLSFDGSTETQMSLSDPLRRHF